jgi:nucleoside triphosphate pyrophosphatase
MVSLALEILTSNGISQMGNEPIILASQSPRRAALLTEARIPFEVIVPVHDEPDFADWRFTPAGFAESAGYYKAQSVAQARPDRIILAADTVVALDEHIFGKPVDRDDARRILSTLADTTHQVITGVSLCEGAHGRRFISHDVTHVTMRRLSEDELTQFLDGGQWRGKAGGYGIQDENDPFVETIDGSFSNVVGLPIELVLSMLATFGIKPESQLD